MKMMWLNVNALYKAEYSSIMLGLTDDTSKAAAECFLFQGVYGPSNFGTKKFFPQYFSEIKLHGTF